MDREKAGWEDKVPINLDMEKDVAPCSVMVKCENKDASAWVPGFQ